MADLGGQSNLIDDLNAKVTTNGANENTGLRVRNFLRNFIDTVWAYIQGSYVQIGAPVFSGTPDFQGNEAAWKTALDIRSASPSVTFDNDTDTASDPGSGVVKFNSITPEDTTQICQSATINGVNKGGLYAIAGSILQYQKAGTSITVEFLIVGVTHTTFTVYDVTYLSGPIPSDGDKLSLRIIPANTKHKDLLMVVLDDGTVVSTESDFGTVEFSISKISAGQFRVDAGSSVFTEDKTYISASSRDLTDPFICASNWANTERCLIQFWDDTFTEVDPSELEIRIRVYT